MSSNRNNSRITNPNFPNIDDLIDELLGEFVIDRLDHPVLERLLKPASPLTVSTPAAPQSAWPKDEEGDENGVD